jgi:hypothetical protein
VVGLSVSFAHQVPTFRAVMRGLAERLGSQRPPVMLGGLAINRFSALATVAGADAFSPDSLTAVAEAARVTA